MICCKFNQLKLYILAATKMSRFLSNLKLHFRTYAKFHSSLKKTTTKIEESPRNSFFLRNPQWERTSSCLLLNSSSSIIHYEESHLVYGLLGSILLDQGFLVKNKLDDTL